jgi:hypothetical protein
VLNSFSPILYHHHDTPSLKQQGKSIPSPTPSKQNPSETPYYPFVSYFPSFKFTLDVPLTFSNSFWQQEVNE